MALNFDSLAVLIMCGLAGIVIVGAGLFLAARARSRRNTRGAEAITAEIIDYFRRSGVEVSVGCVSLLANGRYTAFVESEPMKRFRLSHIIEATLSEHILKTCKLCLEKIYWRFPIKEISAVPEEGGAAPRNTIARPPEVFPAGELAIANDDYINEGLEHYKNLPRAEATEMSWENFQEAATSKEGEHAEKLTAKQPS